MSNVTADMHPVITELWQQGVLQKDIAASVGLSPRTISRYLRDLGLTNNQPPAVYPGGSFDQAREKRLLVAANDRALRAMRAVSPGINFSGRYVAVASAEPPGWVSAVEEYKTRLHKQTAERDQIVADICEKHGVEKDDLRSGSMKKTLIAARAEAYRRMKSELGMSTVRIGQYFHRSHSAIVHALNRAGRA